MIRRLEDALPALAARDVYGTRTRGYFGTYGGRRDDVTFYAQEADGRTTAVLSDAFGHGSLTMDDGADMEELEAFVRFLGLRTLLCGAQTAQRMQWPMAETGSVMLYRGAQADEPPCIRADDPAFSYRDVYALLQTCGFALGGYDAWFADLALRVRRGTADIRCLYRGGVLASTASVLFRDSGAVYLGAVATDPAFRGKGLAGGLVRALAQQGERAEILCGAHRVSFYESLGFQQNGAFTICRFLQ